MTLAIPLLLFAFVFLEEDRRWLAVPFLILAALCKEEIPLVIALMGLYFALRKRRLWPLLITAAAGAYFLVAVGLVIPHFNGGGSSQFLDRYSGGEESMRSLATGFLTHPWRVVTTLLAPSGARLPGEAALALRLHLPGEPAHVPHQSSGTAHQPALEQAAAALDRLPLRRRRGAVRDRRHGAGTAAHRRPAGAPLGASRRTGPHRLHRLLALVVVAVALLATLTVGPLSGARPGWGLALTRSTARDRQALARVPADASVSADQALGPALCAAPRLIDRRSGVDWRCAEGTPTTRSRTGPSPCGTP